METILNNKRFIKITVIFMALLSLLVLAKFINEVKKGDHISRNGSQQNVITVSGKGEVIAI